MDSQLSGNNNELLVVETDKVPFVLKGEKYGVSSKANISIESFPTSGEKINFHYKSAGFIIDDVTVLIQKNTIESIRDNESIVKVSYEEFVKSPVKAVRKLLKN